MCHAALKDGQVVSYAWRSSTAAPHEADISVVVPNSLSYGYKAFTLPEFRGQGIYPGIAQREVSKCSSLGLTTGVSFTELRNTASLRADRTIGNRRVGLAGYFRLGGWVW